MMPYVWVGIGGAIGSIARYWISTTIANSVSEIFPWGTFVANVTGCFVIGLFAVLTGPGGRFGVPPDFRVFFMVGICGGYTTFSSFSLQTLELARAGDMARASLNVLASVLFCLVGVWIGYLVGVAINQGKSA